MTFEDTVSNRGSGNAPVDGEAHAQNGPPEPSDHSLPEGRADTTLAANWTPGVFHIQNGTRVDFASWLIEKKKQSGLTWAALSEGCGVDRLTAYAYNNSDGHPNDPPDEKLAKIADYFATDIEEFHFATTRANHQRSPARGTAAYEKAIDSLGQKILDLNERHRIEGNRPQKLSTTIIRHVLGDQFYGRYANTLTKRKELLSELHDAGFTAIELSNQKQNRQSTRQLSKLEQRVIQRVVDEVREASGEDRLNIAECVRRAHEQLIEKQGATGPSRTPASIRYHIEKLLGIEKQVLLDKGSPVSHGEDILRRLLEEGIDRVENEPRAKIFQDPNLPLTEPDPENKRRQTYLRFASFGHQALIAYLLNPDHYQEIFGEKTTLVKVDFSESDTPVDLYEKFADDAANTTTPVQSDVIEFVDGWLRCDMIFYSEHAGFIVVEVKQRARNTEQFANATKARQQVASYTSVLRDNIQYRNGATQDEAIDVRVAGALCAFQIETSLSRYLVASGSRAVEIPREIVMEYVASEFSDRQGHSRDTPAADHVPAASANSTEVQNHGTETGRITIQDFSSTLWKDRGENEQTHLFANEIPVLSRIESYLTARDKAYREHLEKTEAVRGEESER